MLRFGAIAIVIATLTAGGVVGASAIRGRSIKSHSTQSRTAGESAAAATIRRTPGAAAAPNRAPRAEQPNGDGAPLSPVIPLGESMLATGIVAARTDSSVVVSFDAPMLRTRMPVKFEAFVRRTLPAIYGPGADTALAKLADGGIARQGDLLNELPSRGVRIPVRDGWTFAVYPETRPGQDGPLVVRYRVSLSNR